MSTDLRLHADSLALLVIDVQERLAAAMPDDALERCLRANEVLVETARALHIPVLVTEQYPKGLGPTHARLTARLDAFESPPARLAKTEFDALGNTEVEDALDHLVTHDGDGAVRTLVVTGMESHVCVYQTVRSLVGGGFAVHVPYDATCSRDLDDRRVAMDLMRAAGAAVTTSETVLFELLGASTHPAFRPLSKMLR